MPILRLRSILKRARATLRGWKGIENQRIGWIERDGVAQAGPQTVESGAGELKFDVRPGRYLGTVRFHGGLPDGDNFRSGDIDKNGIKASRFGLGSHCVK